MDDYTIKWTLFSEAPPPTGGHFLVTFKWRDDEHYPDEHYVICLEWEYGQQWWYERADLRQKRDVYAWAPLPMPYDGDAEPVPGNTDIWPTINP